ncbi:MAG: heme ABC transporter ATP-binding protein [Acidobacteriota bacterium]|nr:heme ABC transporter ATP-binding protein [Acidobacteriota bacterium]
MLQAREIVYRVGQRELLHGVSASFEAGRLHLIVGPNGAGKSTFVKVLSRLLRPQAGEVRYGDLDAGTQDERTLARQRAVLSQALELAFPLPVRDLVMMGRYPHFRGRPGRADEEICDEVMAYFDVQDMRDRSYVTLSGGEKQRVNFARVLAQVWRPLPGACRYLFLDEPLTFLDIRHQIDFMKKVRAFVEHHDVVAVGVVHDLNLAARFGDRLLMIDDGRIVAFGSKEDVLTPAHIRSTFHVDPVVVREPGTDAFHLIFH